MMGARYQVTCSLVSLVLAAAFWPEAVDGQVSIDHLPVLSHSVPGDVTIAVMTGTLDRGDPLCTNAIIHQRRIQYVLFYLLGLERLNFQSRLLGNITLGLEFMDDCLRPLVTVGQGLKLLPDRRGLRRVNLRRIVPSRTDLASPAAILDSNGTSGMLSWVNRVGEQLTSSRAERLRDVVGVIGPWTSACSVALSPLLGLFNMPLVAHTATSDELRDRAKYANFLRVTPSDSLQVEVIMDLLVQLGWDYVSVVHNEDNYGFNALKFLRLHAYRRDICIADAYPISDDFGFRELRVVAARLKRRVGWIAHAVVVFMFPVRAFLEAAHAEGVTNVIWIISDTGTDNSLVGLGRTTAGGLYVSVHTQASPSNRNYILTQSGRRHRHNAYFQLMWKYFFDCDLLLPVTGTGNEDDDPGACADKTLADIPQFTFYGGSVGALHPVEVYGLALRDLITAHCPEQLARPERLALRACVTPERLLDNLKNVSLPNPDGTGFRRFDEFGEMAVDFQVKHIEPDGVLRRVAIWRHLTGTFDWLRALRWGAWWGRTEDGPPGGEGGDREGATGEGVEQGGEGGRPRSICALPCALGEFYIQGELPCCWECHRCRDNEYVADNATTCRTCPYLTWPDDVTFTSCETIPASFMRWSDVYGLGLTLLAALGLLVTGVIVTLVVKHRNRKVIKGASLPMISVILLGILLVFADVILLIVEPGDVICVMNRALFAFSCTLIYVPLLLKTHRVYLVFSASSHFSRVSPVAKASVQYTLAVLICLAQAGVLGVAAYYWPISARHSMPVRTQRYVELHCDQDQLGLLVPLSFNLLLILLCSVLAFLTRKLPDNFNESWYIFLAVSTTLFVWVAFLPTYYTAFYYYHRAALLALALTLNGAVTSLCLFGPKLYALFYIDEKEIKVTDFSNESFEKTTADK